MSIPGWKPTPKPIEDWLDRNKWAGWLILILGAAFAVGTLWGEFNTPPEFWSTKAQPQHHSPSR